VKIKTLTLNNFRAFPGPAPQSFRLDGKNLLVYGENGSGKSSIYHALKTYFTLEPVKTGVETCNAFSNIEGDEHWIEVELDDGVTPRWIGSPGYTGQWTNDGIVVRAALRRSCLDYRALLDTNYAHGDKAIDLFDIAVRDLLGDFRVPIEGVPKTISQLWQRVIHLKPYYRFKGNLMRVAEACASFNQGFNLALEAIKPEVDRILPSLPVDGMVLESLEFSGVTFNSPVRRFDGRTLYPVIKLRDHLIELPQHFLNEARLSALGLAIYLAGRLTSVPTGGGDLKLLVMDDVLIGIDLANRLPLLDLLVDRFSEWQIVLLTHDRVWYDMARLRLSKGVGWNAIEVYESMRPDTNIPQPVVRQVDCNIAEAALDQARLFLSQGYIGAAANYARSAYEVKLRLLCEELSIPIPYKISGKKVSSDMLHGALMTWITCHDEYSSWNTTLKTANHFKNMVLNPNSHSLPETITKSEVNEAIIAVNRFVELRKTVKFVPESPMEDVKTILARPGLSSEQALSVLALLRAIFAKELHTFCRGKVSFPLDSKSPSAEGMWKAALLQLPEKINGSGKLPADKNLEVMTWLIKPLSSVQKQSIDDAKVRELLDLVCPNKDFVIFLSAA
jgi:hypothetical protein